MTCPEGKIRRKGSVVKGYTRKDGVYVKGSKRSSTCIPDKGVKGKTSKSSILLPGTRSRQISKVLPKLKKGGLAKYGLKDLEDMTVADRMKGYEKAVKKEGYAPIVRRLNVLANYTKKSNPNFSKLVRADMARIKKKFYNKYSKSSKSSRRSKSSKSDGKKQVKAGVYTTSDGKKRQLYHLTGSSAKFYRYLGSDGKMKKRYV